eukprot:gene8676-1069_t
MSNKSELRRWAKQLLAALTKQEKITEAAKICHKINALSAYQNAKRVAFFLSMPDENALAAGKSCFVPRYTKECMNMYKVKDWEDVLTLPKTKWNIAQPEDAREDALSNGGLDIIIVPGLLFSKTGGRLGRGKGYYDSYIKRLRGEGLTGPTLIAIGFDCQLVDDVPMQEHDQRVDHILTASHHVVVQENPS